MKITVAICTRNRATDLARALQSLCEIEVPVDADWEVVVVDNGSSDNTQEVVSGFATRLPVRAVLEPRAGISNARNAAVANATGDYVFWMDDDITVDRGWLTAYWRAIQEFPDVAVFGGAIEPVLMPPTPSWFSDCQTELSALLAHHDPSSYQPEIIGSKQRPYSANCAIRTAELRQHSFDPKFGRAPGQRRLGEETRVIGEIFRAGGTGRWVPEARAKHWIPPGRQTLSYVCQYYQAGGDGTAFVRDSNGTLNIPGMLSDSALKALARYGLYALLRLTSPPKVWIGQFKRYAYHAGVIRYILQRLQSGAVRQ